VLPDFNLNEDVVEEEIKREEEVKIESPSEFMERIERQRENSIR
jgi:hypothetical protein